MEGEFVGPSGGITATGAIVTGTDVVGSSITCANGVSLTVVDT